MRIGIISDTHGSLPASVHEVFAGVDHIIHAGDIGGTRILEELETIAPVIAVHGNMDTDELEWRLPDTRVAKLADQRVVVAHKVETVRASGVGAGADVVVSGHTHRSLVQRVDGTLFVNPGSASHPRDGGGPTAALLELGAQQPSAEIVAL